jgi:hypothetical protein
MVPLGQEPGLLRALARASCGGNSARLQPDGAGHSANELYGRGFRETSWKPSVFGLDEAFASDTFGIFGSSKPSLSKSSLTNSSWMTQ